MCGFVCFVNESELSNKYFNLIKKGEIPIHRGPIIKNYIEIKIFLLISNVFQ